MPTEPETRLDTSPGLLALARERMPRLDSVTRATHGKKLRVVPSREEVQALLAQLQGTPWLVASLLYGGGLRLMEALRLRVKDIAVERGEVIVREGKGGRDRVTMLHAADGERCARRPQPT